MKGKVLAFITAILFGATMIAAPVVGAAQESTGAATADVSKPAKKAKKGKTAKKSKKAKTSKAKKGKKKAKSQTQA